MERRGGKKVQDKMGENQTNNQDEPLNQHGSPASEKGKSPKRQLNSYQAKFALQKDGVFSGFVKNFYFYFWKIYCL